MKYIPTHFVLHTLNWRDGLNKLKQEWAWYICGILRKMAQRKQWTDKGIIEKLSNVVFLIMFSNCLSTVEF